MCASPQRTRVNSFGYFLEAVRKETQPSARAGRPDAALGETADCTGVPCDDPQLTILRALAGRDRASCALDLMKETRLLPTVLLGTLKVMNEFGLVKIIEAASDAAGGVPPSVELTPCGRKALAVYQE